jgi:hypothetical protein
LYRYTTEAGLQLVTSLVHIAKVKADTRDLKQRQLDAEGKKKRPNNAMLKTLKEALVHTQVGLSLPGVRLVIHGAHWLSSIACVF